VAFNVRSKDSAMAQTAMGMEIEGMETGMVTGISGRWK